MSIRMSDDKEQCIVSRLLMTTARAPLAIRHKSSSSFSAAFAEPDARSARCSGSRGACWPSGAAGGACCGSPSSRLM